MRYTVQGHSRGVGIERILPGEYFMDWSGDLFRNTGQRASGHSGKYVVSPSEHTYLAIKQSDGSLFTFGEFMTVYPVKQTKDAEFQPVD